MNKLIYGKNDLTRIVSIEVTDDSTEIFRELEDGSVVSEFVPNKFWILSEHKFNSSWHRLEGDLPYQFGYQCKDRQQFMKTRSMFRNHDIFSIWNPEEACMVKDGYTYFLGMKHDEVSALSFDIETNGLVENADSRIFLIANTLRKNGVTTRRMFCYDDYENDGAMLLDWAKWVREVDPSIMLGHNIYGYDLPWMQHVANMFGVQIDIGRDGSPLGFVSYESKFRRDATQFIHYHKPTVYGREFVDTMFLSIKYDVGRKYPTFGLKTIIKFEGLEVEGRQHYDASQIRLKYKDPVEWELIKTYAEHDGDDSLALFDLMAPPFFYMNQSVPKTFQTMIETATGSQLNSIMVRAYLQDRHSLPKTSEAEPFEGAISFGNPGIYHNVYKIDVASLYPSIMIQYEVYDEEKDPKGYFKELVETWTNERLKNKALAKTSKYHDDLQASQKIAINSLYGFLGATGLLFNSPEKAAFITRTGRETLQQAIDWAEAKDFQIVNADTDSISFAKQDMSEIENRDGLLDEINALCPKRIAWEDDGYFHTLIVLKAKNYIMYDGVNTKIKGSALKDTKKEPALKEFIQNIVQSIISKEYKYQEIYNKYILEVLNITDITRWAAKKTITDKVLNPKRTNEQKVLDALKGRSVQQGDKIYVYFKSDDSLSLVEDYDGDYNRSRMLERVFKTSKVFDNIIEPGTFINYKLKRNQEKLSELSIGSTEK